MAIDDGRPASGSLQWLEDEVHQAKVQMAKLQQQADQLQNQLWRVGEEAQRTQEVLVAIRVQLEGLSGLQEQVRQIGNEAAMLKEQQASMRSTMESSQHQQEAIIDKARQEWSQALRRLETIEKSVTATEQRFTSLEEGQRPIRNDIAQLRQGMAEVERNLDEIQIRSDRNLEASKRVEQTLDHINGELASLAKQDETTSERLQLYAEHVRRLEEQVSNLIADQTTHDDLFQKIEVVRTEAQHLGERVAGMEKMVDSQRTLLEDQMRQMDLLDPKLQGQAERLIEIQRLIASYHEDLLTHLQRWSQLYEKQRRRQISALEQEMRELKQYELKLRNE